MIRCKPVVEFNNVGVRYKSEKRLFSDKYYDALQDVSLQIYPGETLGVVGRNGAGKSTLLRLLAGIIAPDWGTVIRQNIKTSLIALQAGFDPVLSGRDNALFCGMLLGFTKNDVLEKLDRIIEFSELGHFIDEPVKTYSTGMAGRLGFSIALELDSELLLIDEVLGVGDDAFRKKSTDAMKAKIKSNQTVVLVSHAANVVRDMCDRAIWIENGLTKAQGDTEEVVSMYQASMLVK